MPRVPLCLLAVALGCGVAFPSHATASASTPTVFAPGVISGPAHDAAPAFSRDNHTVVFGRSDADRATLLVARRTAAGWSRPIVAPFSGRRHDMEPAFAPDGSWLVFVSDRPVHAGDTPLRGHYQGASTPAGTCGRSSASAMAGASRSPCRPKSMPAMPLSRRAWRPMAACISCIRSRPPANSGCSARPAVMDITARRCRCLSATAVSDVDPAVSSDESFIVFGSSRRPGHDMELFIAYRDHGRWSTPVWMGEQVNSRGSDAEARLSPDGHTLYFSSERLAGHAGNRRPAWDNGKYNIWQVSLAPWLPGRSAAGDAASRSR